ncbi:MAG TPA: FAD-dependent monooxygenase [Mycobacterium sp.]|nr:FAD-dependent monooxygenase [Mycobacterium sp.]
MNTNPNPDVVVVGAGPAGLVAAAELARRGVRVRVIDKLAQPTDQSRAIAVHARSLDMFDRMGIVDEMVSTGIKATAMQLYAGHSRLFRIPLGGVDSAFPFTLTTAQTETERVLGDHLQSLGVIVERGVELVALAQDGGAAELTVRHDDGSTEQVSTSWVIGADGAHSTVRKVVGTKLAGSFVGERFLLGDVDAEHGLDLDSMHTFFAPHGPVVVLPMLDGRMRFLAEVHDAPGTPMNMHPTQDELQAILDRRIGGIRVVRSHWLTSFEIHHARVPAYRWGRVFLAGDAAHIHSPAGGQGMNTGMQDAFNLAWKLAAVVNGQAGDTLLDSYEAERIPVADSVIAFTDRLTRAGTLSGVPRRIRDVVIRMLSHVPAARRFMANMAEEVNINYRDSPIAVGSAPKHAKVAAGDHLPHAVDAAVQKQLSVVCGVQNTGHVLLTVASGHVAPAAGEGQVQVLVTADDIPVAGYDTVIADPNGVVAQRFGLKNGGRVVIRPDGYIGAVASLDDTTTVADYFAKVRG